MVDGRDNGCRIPHKGAIADKQGYGMRYESRSFAPIVALALAAALAILPGSALAYIGAGVGAGAIGAVLGVVGSIFLALFAVIWYPIKRLLRRGKQNSATMKQATSRIRPAARHLTLPILTAMLASDT
jgi:hypothetical protein